jgi:hypothetical protein
MREKIHNKKFDGNIRIYYRTPQQLASGKHDQSIRNSVSIITSPTMTNIKTSQIHFN